MARQEDPEGRSLPDFGFRLNIAAGLFDDAVDHRQPETRALAYLLGCEERLEYLVHDVGRNTGAGIGHLDQHHVLMRHVGIIETGHFRGRDVAGAQRQLAALGHRVARIDAKIDQHLLELRQVSLHRPEIAAVFDIELDVGAG